MLQITLFLILVLKILEIFFFIMLQLSYLFTMVCLRAGKNLLFYFIDKIQHEEQSKIDILYNRVGHFCRFSDGTRKKILS